MAAEFTYAYHEIADVGNSVFDDEFRHRTRTRFRQASSNGYSVIGKNILLRTMSRSGPDTDK